jgi:hypothetical protein
MRAAEPGQPLEPAGCEPILFLLQV